MKSNYIFKNKKKFSEKTTTIILFVWFNCNQLVTYLLLHSICYDASSWRMWRKIWSRTGMTSETCKRVLGTPLRTTDLENDSETALFTAYWRWLREVLHPFFHTFSSRPQSTNRNTEKELCRAAQSYSVQKSTSHFFFPLPAAP